MDFEKWKVIGKIKEARDVYTFILKNENELCVDYQAGQFLTFIFEHNGKEIRRSYSISSTPNIDDNISITVKRTANGEISRHLINHVHLNDILTSIKPAGRFTTKTNINSKNQFFFIAAGSGIVPVFSLIKKILKEEPLSKVVLIYQNHHEKDIIFKKHFEELMGRHSLNFKWINFLGHPEEHKQRPQKLTNFLLEKLVLENKDDSENIFFYVCGPVSFMRMAQFTLKWMGFDDDYIRKENFTVDFIPPPPLITDLSPKQIIIHYDKNIYQIETAYPITILQAALDKNIQLPYSCRSGRCATCVAKCIKGKIKMSNNEVLTDKDLQEGLVLTCVGYAETDLELEC